MYVIFAMHLAFHPSRVAEVVEYWVFLLQTGCDLYKQVQLDTGQRSLSLNHSPNNLMQQIQQVDFCTLGISSKNMDNSTHMSNIVTYESTYMPI